MPRVYVFSPSNAINENRLVSRKKLFWPLFLYAHSCMDIFISKNFITNHPSALGTSIRTVIMVNIANKFNTKSTV